MAVSREDIESLGWSHYMADWYDFNGDSCKIPHYLYFRLRKWKDDEIFIEGYRSNPSIYPDSDDVGRLFDGVIENKEELIILMKMLRLTLKKQTT